MTGHILTDTLSYKVGIGKGEIKVRPGEFHGIIPSHAVSGYTQLLSTQ